MAETKAVSAEAARHVVRGPVRITIPADVGFNLDKLGRVLGNIAERLGCGRCFSGAVCFFVTERNFVVDPELQVHGVASDPMPFFGGGIF